MLGTILLFVLLSPGILITIPPGTEFFSGKTSLLASIVHGIIFTMVLYYKHAIPGIREALNLCDSVF
jgi:hypothetical protein